MNVWLQPARSEFVVAPGHALFDKGFISCDSSGYLLLSQKLTSSDLHILNVDPLKKICLSKENEYS